MSSIGGGEGVRVGTGFVIRPTVTISIVYFGLCSIWFLWLLLTLKYPADSAEPMRFISLAQLVGLTLINFGFLFAFVLDFVQVRNSPPGLRRGHFAGAILALLLLAVIQIGLVLAYGPIGR